jgi:hypothetical protein
VTLTDNVIVRVVAEPFLVRKQSREAGECYLPGQPLVSPKLSI